MGEPDDLQEQFEIRMQLVLAVICLVLLLTAWIGTRHAPQMVGPWAFYLYLGAYATGGFFPTWGVLKDFREWKFNVNFLMVSAAMGAACIGEMVEGSVLMFLFSFSGALEALASGRSRHAIRSLMKLRPEEARLIVGQEEKWVPVSTLKPGDVIQVLPGESLAVDGEIVEGNTSIDESSLTGESIPVDKFPGNRVMAGTFNKFGSVKVRMDREASETTLSKIFKIVEEAQHQKAPTQRLLDEYGGPYAKCIVGVTIVVFLWGWLAYHEAWRESLYRAMTLMVVASPCALVISIPSAVLASIANGARHGILIKGGLAVEIIGKVRAVALDKTGTLTQGKPQLTDARYAPGWDPDVVLADVASVEMNSEHPLAQVLVREAREKGLKFERGQNSRAIPGMGVEGRSQGSVLRIGSEAFVCLHGGMEPWVRETLVAFRARGLTCLVAARDKPLAVFGVSDSLRSGSQKTVETLKKMGIEPVMLTGDNPASAGEFAGKLGIREFHASLLPDQKVMALREMIRKYSSVVMVGDGVNDAPALAAANVGIAMGGIGSDAALENADVVIMGDKIEHIPEIIELGRRTRKIIHQNLVFALGVIIVLMAATFLGKLTLAFGVVGHEGSTLLVVLNSLQLLYSKPKSLQF